MKKLLIIILYIFFVKSSYANGEQPLLFQLKAEITLDSLFYKITEISVYPENVNTNYDSKLRTFEPVELSLQLKTNILKGSSDTYRYSLSIFNEKSTCKTYGDVVEPYKNPEVSTYINGHREILTRKSSNPIDFLSDYVDGANTYLSDEQVISVDFFEPQPSKLNKDFKYCEGEFTLMAGLEL